MSEQQEPIWEDWWGQFGVSEKKTGSQAEETEGKSAEFAIEELKDLKVVKLEAVQQKTEELVVENLYVKRRITSKRDGDWK